MYYLLCTYDIDTLGVEGNTLGYNLMHQLWRLWRAVAVDGMVLFKQKPAYLTYDM